MKLGELNQYQSICKEITELNVTIKDKTVHGTVNGSDTAFPYIQHTIEVSGIEDANVSKTMLARIHKLEERKRNVELFVEGDFCSSSPRISVEDNIDAFTDEVSKELKKEVVRFLEKTQKLGTDIVGFSGYAKRNFMTKMDFDNYKWKEKYKNAKFDVKINFSVRRTGLVVRSERH